MYRSTTKAQSLFESGQDKMSAKPTSANSKTKGAANRGTKGVGGKSGNILDNIDEEEG